MDCIRISVCQARNVDYGEAGIKVLQLNRAYSELFLGIHQRKVELPLNTRRRTGSDGSCLKYADAEFCFVSEVKAFFRHCPSCGRRFHIKLVRKEEVAEEPLTEHLTPAEEEMGYGFIHGNPWMTQLAEGPPIYVDIEEFDYTYKCTHCGHQWSEVHTEQDTARN